MSPRCAALLLCGLLGLGCTAIPQADAMRPESVARRSAAAAPASAQLHVAGGQDFDFRISDAAFEQALRAAIEQSGLFRLVPQGGELRLDVVLGDDAGVEGREIAVLWSLSRADTGQTLWQDLVTSKGKSYQFVGVVRLRRSIELAGQENIRLGIERLAALDLAALRSAPRPPPPAADPALPSPR